MNTGMYSEKELQQEIVANACAEVLYDSKAIQAMAKENRTLYERVREFIRGLINKIRNVYQQENSFRQESVLMRDVSEELAELWDTALLEKMNGAAETQQDAQYSLRETKVPTREELEAKDPINVVDISQAQTSGTYAQRRKALLANIDEVIAQPYVNKDTNAYIFLTRASYTHAFSNPGEIQINAAEHMPELVENAVLTHAEAADHGSEMADGVYTFFAAANTGTSVQPVKLKVKEYSYSGQDLPQNIRNYFADKTQNYASTYDTVVLEVQEIDESPTGSARGKDISVSSQGPEGLSTIKIADLLNLVKGDAEKYIPQSNLHVSEKDADKQTKFSMREPVEQVGNLLALHNLTEQNLLDTIRLGGFPMPSIAVVKTDTGHSKYGPISVVLSSNSIDPEADSRNHVYGGDAYTPTAPDVEYPVDSKRSQQLEQMLDQQARKVAGGIFGNTSVLRPAGVEDSVNMSAEELANRLADNDTVRAAYLADQGETLDPVMADKVWNRKFGNDVLNTIIGRIGVQDLAEIAAQLELGNSTETALGEHSETLNDILREYYTRQNEPMLQKMAAVKKWTADEISEKRETRLANRMSEVSQFQMENLVRNAWDMYQDGGQTKGEIDRMATRDALREKADRNQVKQWLLSQLDGLLGEPGIYNGKDRYTSNGNRRSFASLHYAYTAENIVRAMTQNQRQRGEGVWSHDSNALMSTATPEYSDIDSIRSDSGRLQQIDEQEYNDLLSDLDDDINAVIKQVRKQNKPHSDNSFEEENIIGGILIDAAAGKQTPAAIIKAFSKEGYTIDKDTAKRIQALYHSAAEMPTGYFAAKPERVVDFNEVLAVVVPDSANETLLQQIQSAGMPVQTYTAGDEQSRLQVINSVEGAKFSARDSEGNQLTEAQQSYFADSVVRDTDGKLMVMYHGRVSEFTVFDRAFASPDGNMGAGFYFTSSKTDADSNYGNENGADLAGKIDALSDRLLLSGLYDPYEVWSEARKRLVTAEPNTMAVYLNVKNPVILGGKNETSIELVDFIHEIENILADSEYSDGQADLSQLYELGYGSSRPAGDVISAANEALIYVEDDEGRSVSKEIIRCAFERIGFDGIVDYTVSNKWGTDSARSNKMEGVNSDTFHCIVFDSNQVKLVTNQEPTSNEDIRYSIRETQNMTISEQLSAFRKGELKSSDSFYFGETPAVYGDGFSGYPLVMNQKDFKKSRTLKHNVPNRVFKKLAELLSAPIMSFEENGRIAAVLDDVDADGKPLVAALHAGENMDRSQVTAVTSLYGVDNWTAWLENQSKKEISIYDKKRANSYLQTYGSSASVEEAIRSTGESVSQDVGSVNPQFSQRIYSTTDDEILSDLDTSKLTTQAEREAYFRWERRRSQYQNWQNKVDELKLIHDMRRRNPTLGMIELWHRLWQRGYTRRPESLFRVMRNGFISCRKAENTYKPKLYEQMTHPGERVQVDVKVVPRRCIAVPELRLFQYTAIDKFTRLRFLAAYPEQSIHSSADFL